SIANESARMRTRSPREGAGAGLRARGRLRARGSGPRRSIAGKPVDRLADQVGVAVVAGVLLDHVEVDPAQRDLLALPVDEGLVQPVAGGPLPRPGALAGERREILGHVGIVEVVEVGVGPLLGG